MKKRIQSITVLLVVFVMLFARCSSALAHAGKAFYLQGKLSDKTIAVKMLVYDETPAIRYVQYFFSNDKRDRYMAGKQTNGFWRFATDVQSVQSNPQPEGSLNIAPDDNKWKGSWISLTGQKQAITLTPIPADFMPPQFSHLPQVREMDPYERWRLAGLHFTKTGTENYRSGLQSISYVEQESGISFFRLGPGNSGVNMSKVNATLEATHLSLVQKYFAYSPQKEYVKPKTALLYLTNELVSFCSAITNRFLSLTTSKAELATTLDIPTGEPLKIEDLLWLDKTVTRPAAGDFFALYQYRKKVFATTIFRWLQALYPQQMKNDRCGIDKPESWNLPAWNLTEKGLALGVNAADDCGTFQWAIIPYDTLQPYVERKYHLPVRK